MEEARLLPPGVDADTPLTVVAWRALADDHRRRADERAARERAEGRLRDALVRVAEEAHRLRRTAPDAAARLAEALALADVDTLSPEGEPYTGALVELFENVVQRPDPGAAGPRVAEVIAPAVMVRGVLARTGRAVIGVPANG